MSSTKYQNIPLEQIETNVIQDIDYNNEISANSSPSYSNAGYETVGQDDDSDTYVYKDNNSISPTDNKILEIIDDEIVNYTIDDEVGLINDNEININLKNNIVNDEKSSIFGSTFNFTNSIVGAGIYFNNWNFIQLFNLYILLKVFN